PLSVWLLSPCVLFCFSVILVCRSPTPTLFPYTTLFRSLSGGRAGWPAILSSLKSMLETGKAMVIPMQPPQRMLDALKELGIPMRSEEHTSELQSRFDLVCRLLLEKKKRNVTHAERAVCQ